MPDLTPNLNIPKPLGTENVNRASFNSIYDAIDENASQAANIRIEDTANQFTSENVEGALGELFTFAGNGKADMAAVIGAPATSADTFAQLKTKAQNAKNTLASNLTAKGTAATGTETLASLAGKVANVQTGKKFASGTILTSGSTNTFLYADSGSRGMPFIEVSGLNFKPSLIVIERLDDSALNGTTVYSEQVDVFYPKVAKVTSFNGSNASINTYNFRGDSLPAYVNGTGFKLPVYVNSATYKWVAYE